MFIEKFGQIWYNNIDNKIVIFWFSFFRGKVRMRKEERGDEDMMMKIMYVCSHSRYWMHKQLGLSILYPIKYVRDGA